MTDYKQLCAELLDALEYGARLIRAPLAQPKPAGATRRQLMMLADDMGMTTVGAVTPAEYARAALARWGNHPGSLDSSPQPVPVSERLPGHIEQALIKAECALADIAEGEAEESDGDPLEWAEKRAADALARIRPVMRQHQIQTSEWPPVPPTP